MIQKQTIEQIVSEKIADSYMFLVEVTVSSQNTISVFVDSELAVTLNDCIEISKHIESKLNREIEDLELNVSSAGLSEPFKVERQYHKNIGKEIEIINKDGSKIKAILTGFSENIMEIETTQKVKPEGSKKKVEVQIKEQISLNAVKSVRLHIKI